MTLVWFAPPSPVPSRRPLFLGPGAPVFRPTSRPFAPSFYYPHPPPPHPYTRASSVYSAVVQLYARSHQLPTNLSFASRSRDRRMLSIRVNLSKMTITYSSIVLSSTIYRMLGALLRRKRILSSLPAPILPHLAPSLTRLCLRSHFSVLLSGFHLFWL